MAIDVTQKALNLATDLMNACDALMNALERLNDLKDEKESAGVDFTAAAVESALTASATLKHIDGNSLNNVLTSGAALLAWMVSNFHDDNLQKVRP